jgi:hypothetical protein
VATRWPTSRSQKVADVEAGSPPAKTDVAELPALLAKNLVDERWASRGK